MLKFLKKKIPKIFFLKENKESDGMFGNISFIEMEFSILINQLINQLFDKHVLKWPRY
jgi:hypothetical protein